LTIAAFAAFGYGCGGSNNSSSFSASFTPSTTASAPNLIKIVPKGSASNKLVVDVILYGPTTSTDLNSFSFDVVIGDTAVLGPVPNSAMAGTALTVTAGQTIQALAAPDSSDPSHIVVGVSKVGPGVGNGVAGSSAVVVELSFGFLKAGVSNLSIATSPAPVAIDHNGTVIGTISFDTAVGSASGVSTGGGGY
jgi:hypothetical protein